ncbi:chemotaxis protein [Desulfovibrio litoralis]|uniref:Two-component system, chemotaxis family, response regulator CheV n=1 Tax=Desulfovibrio litoralis DSM 11393 TaxID=1121455 RepID=A0A1M7TA17_9BACT|nr:chemotaxis protein [Desulfovibrio litoralis]SHN67554.1 two-component system, chemotaxis family, response regulator CheV [Desulfovibrio litoralis DSM 11393]
MSQTNILLEAGTNELEIVAFHLDEEENNGQGVYKGYYGVNVAKVLEIIRLPKITEMPEARHPSVLGAFNLRSKIIPLVDLSVWLGKKRANTEPPKVIVTEFNGMTTAFLVSGVNRIHRISWQEVEPPNTYVSALSHNTITGVVKLEGRIIFLLDLERIVTNLNPQLNLRFDSDFDFTSDTRRRAILADDSMLVREMLKDLLEKANFEVQALNNGKEAWDLLERLRDRSEAEGRPITDYVQVVISDIEMPSMDGHNLCKRIKDDRVLHELPVLLFSSLITDRLRHKGDSVGADAQISKPEVTALAKHAMRLIEEREQARKS